LTPFEDICNNVSMPYKNTLKVLAPNCYYHLYGRGVNKMDIFSDKEDYRLFAYQFKKYLTPDFKETRLFKGQKIQLAVNSVADQVHLYAFCLMPNHFHLLVKNIEKEGVSKLMRRVLTGYSSYFNNKQGRQGPLIQGSYRAVNVGTGEQFIYVSRYIHLNPVNAGLVKKAKDYEYTSYKNYLEKKKFAWLKLNEQLLLSTDYRNIESYCKDISEDVNSGIII